MPWPIVEPHSLGGEISMRCLMAIFLILAGCADPSDRAIVCPDGRALDVSSCRGGTVSGCVMSSGIADGPSLSVCSGEWGYLRKVFGSYCSGVKCGSETGYDSEGRIRHSGVHFGGEKQGHWISWRK